MKKRIFGVMALLTVAILWICSCGDKNSVSIVGGTTIDTSKIYLVSTVLTPVGKQAGTPYKSGDTASVKVEAFWDVAKTIKVAAGREITVSSVNSNSKVKTDKAGSAIVKVVYVIKGDSLSIKDSLPVIFEGKGQFDTAYVQYLYEPMQKNANIKLTSDKSAILANGKSKAIISFLLTNDEKNPIQGKKVLFKTSAGTITSTDTTDETGIATATLTSDQFNDTAKVEASVDGEPKFTEILKVLFTGVNISNIGVTKTIIPNTLDTALVIAQIINADSTPIYNTKIKYIKHANSTLTLIPVDTVSNVEGKFRCKVVGLLSDSSSMLSDTFSIVGGGYSLKVPVNYYVNSIKFSDITTPKFADGDTTKVTVRYLARDQVKGIKSAKIALVVSSGTVISKDTITDASGYASIRFVNPNFATKVTVTAIASIGSVKTEGKVDINFESAASEVKLTSDKYVILANGKSQATISFLLTNDNNNPISGKKVLFKTDAGTITSTSTTDEMGVAKAVLTSDALNDTAKIEAVVEGEPKLSAFVKVLFTGVKIANIGSVQSIIPNNIDTGLVIAQITDADSIPIYNTKINYIKNANSTLTLIPIDTLSDYEGKFRCKVVGQLPPSSLASSDTFTILGGGYSLKVPVNYSSNTLKFSPIVTPKFANGKDTTTVTVRYLAKDQLTGVPAAKIVLNVTSGTVVSKDLVTNATGYASIRFVNPDFATNVTVTASATSGTIKTEGSVDIYFQSGGAETITLSATPEVIGTGGVKAQLTAQVRDKEGNIVRDELVSFQFFGGPGAGEKLSPPTALTNESGIASTFFVSGSSTSGQQAIRVVARTSNGKVSDTIPLTISGDPKSVVFTYDNSKIIKGTNGTYGLNCAAIVADGNGNIVPDSLPVIFSMEVIGHYCYSYIDNEGKQVVLNTPLFVEGNPQSAILIKKEVKTAGGLSNNLITYGQTDALRLKVRVWAEVKGIVSNKREFMLPIEKEDFKYFDPLEDGGYNCK